MYVNGSSFAVRAELRIPGNLLDQHYRAVCQCGWSRNFGYMGITCDRMVEWHRERGPSHNVTITITDAPPLDRVEMVRRHAVRELQFTTLKVTDIPIPVKGEFL